MESASHASSQKLIDALNREMHQRYGTVLRVTERIGVGRNYFSQAAGRGSIDLAVLLAALALLEIHPTTFFEKVLGPGDPKKRLSNEYRRADAAFRYRGLVEG